MATLHHLPLPALRAAIADLMLGFGSAPREVDLVTDNLLEANLTGHDSHGIGMLPRYANAFLEGGLRPNAQATVKIDHGALLALDGNAGFGQVIGHEAMTLAIARARQHGSCIMALGNSHHLCRIGAWAEMATAAGLISVHFVNVISRPIVAPYAGGDARFGTNPFTVGIPVPGGEPIVLDFATSVIAQGKARVAHNKGEALAPGQVIDDHGRASTDPRWAVVPPFGALRTFGDHKGFGLALVCELLGGALAGGMTLHEADATKQRVLNGMLSIVFDPQRLSTGDVFAQEMAAFVDWVKASPPAEGHERVRIAGEPERETRAQRLAHGIPVDAATWAELCETTRKLGRDPAAFRRLAGLAA